MLFTPSYLDISKEIIISDFQGIIYETYMDVSENNGTPKSSILIGFFHYVHHPFWGFSSIFGNTHMDKI